MPRRAADVARTERIYANLFIALTALMVLLPFFGEGWIGLLLAAGLYLAMLAVLRELYERTWPVVVTAVLFAFSVWGATHEGATLEHEAAHVAAAIGYIIVEFAIIRDTLRRDEVSLRTVLGASSAYMLVGLLFANIFALAMALDPQAFHFPDRPMTSIDRHSMLTYLSYITMTTVGYGDVLPVSMPARFLCVIEALFGQLFVAILIGRLVGLTAAQVRRRS